VKLTEDQYLKHYGILRRSGRYPWGSGGIEHIPEKRSKTFLDQVDECRRQGLSDKQIADGFSISLRELQQLKTIAKTEYNQSRILQAQRLHDKGMSNGKIAEAMGLPNESSVRSLLTPGRLDKEQQLQSIADMLKREVDKKEFLDIGSGVELSLPLSKDPGAPPVGVPKDKFQTAVAMLRNEGYEVHPLKLPQATTKEMTTYKVLVKPGVSQRDVFMNRHNIRTITEFSDDQGRSWKGIVPPESISSKRVGINYAEDGGTNADGVIYVKPGAKGLDMGGSQYAQVRIAVDDSHYLKGMAVYKTDMDPNGPDLIFNTNKSRKDVGNKLDVMKPLNRTPEGNVDWENPFGAAIKPGGQRGHFNIIREEGDWNTWSKKLPSQMLSKQSPKLIKEQLDRSYTKRQEELDKINSLTNPTVKKMLLKTFSDGADSASGHLKAVGMPNQATKVLMPIPSLKENEVYAPSFPDGTRLALVRFPHGGTFEIPQVTVNNKSRNAKSLLGQHAPDAIGIHPKVAERLSGADFDGDHVIAIPNNQGKVISTPALKGLDGFDPKRAFPPYDGMRTVDGGHWNAAEKRVDYGPKGPRTGMQKQMGDVSNLITDMTIKGANEDELARAVRHSMVVIDSEKHHLDIKSSYRDNGIKALKEKYQPVERRGKIVGGGAATLLSRAGAGIRLPEQRKRRASEGGFIDPATGKKMYVRTGATYIDRKTGKPVEKTFEVKPQLKVIEDARTLISRDGGTEQEHLYADYSNRLKAMANGARKEMVSLPGIKRQPSAAVAYSSEVESLKSKLNEAILNRPKERRAQVLAGKVISQVKRDNPDMDSDDEKKLKNQVIAEMRVRVKAKKDPITFTPREWEAIQAGAISNKMLEDLLTNADIEKVRELATPHPKKLMSDYNKARAKQMLARGATQAEVAAQLGVSVTTLEEGLK
jgi:DNA-binding CsgD family transcriptional regulator